MVLLSWLMVLLLKAYGSADDGGMFGIEIGADDGRSYGAQFGHATVVVLFGLADGTTADFKIIQK